MDLNNFQFIIYSSSNWIIGELMTENKQYRSGSGYMDVQAQIMVWTDYKYMYKYSWLLLAPLIT